jgi:hypothetical protein
MNHFPGHFNRPALALDLTANSRQKDEHIRVATKAGPT